MEFKLNISEANNDELYDVIIIGAGPGGYTAGIYASRYNLKTLIIGEILGGTGIESSEVDNYPAIPNINGKELMEKMLEHSKKLGCNVLEDRVSNITKKEDIFEIETNFSGSFRAKKVILVTGKEKMKMNVPGENEFKSKGVSYCAICDSTFFKEKIVGVVGGGDSAISSSIMLNQWASEVHIFLRGEKFRATPKVLEQINDKKNIFVHKNKSVTEVYGEKFVKGVKLKNNLTQEIEDFVLDGIFVEIGSRPNNELAKNLGVLLDENGYLIVDKKQETNVKGLYAAGDSTTNSNKYAQIICAASEGAIAANSIFEELN